MLSAVDRGGLRGKQDRTYGKNGESSKNAQPSLHFHHHTPAMGKAQAFADVPLRG
jgi:hypothetical protein